MDTELIEKRKLEIVNQFGHWTAHNIQLGGDIYTIGQRVVGDEFQLRRIIQITSDIAREPLSNLRVLDLGCLEGLYALEFGLRGAEVVAIEGREASIVKARFAKEALAIKNLELVQDDVRNLSKQKYGSFDVVLCSGILYHLDAPDVFSFMENVAEVCQRFAIIDTHVSRTCEEFHVHNNKKYCGLYAREHSPTSTSQERAKNVWASLDNPKSFWFTRPSLYNLLAHVGFTSVFECHYPREMYRYKSERTTLVALKGRRENLLSSPLVNALPDEDWPEIQQPQTNRTMKKLRRLMPQPIKDIVRKFR
jgi:SAM-dependent methyltransferase